MSALPGAPVDEPLPGTACTVCPIVRGLLAGAIGGLAVGLADVLLVWGKLSQFLDGGGKARLALHAGALYGLFGALATAGLVATAIGFRRYTVLGPLLRHGRERHDAARARDPREALAGLALAIAAVPVIAGALLVAYRIGLQTIMHRKHQGLVVAVTVAATAALLLAAIPVTVALGRAVELGLRAAARGRTGRALSHPLAPPIAVATLLLVGGIVGYLALRTSLSLDQLRLRPYVVAAALLAAVAAAWPLTALPARALRRLPRAGRYSAYPAIVGTLLILTLATGASDAVRKGGKAYTGLSEPLAAALRAVLDFDRDGYSPILGGGDCRDGDARVHPGAFDIPDDGIDQNCIGGDLTLDRRPEDVHFVPVPPSVPAQANVLLITIDTVRADHVGAYGYARATTPAIDRLAAEGTLFENAFAHAPSTRYSIPAILTGRYPSQVAWDTSIFWPGLSTDNRTIAEILKEQGFATGALLNYEYFETRRRMDQGFDSYDNSHARLHAKINNDPASTRGTSSREQADAAITWIDAHAGGRFFLWVHFYDPHFQFERHEGTTGFGDDKVAMYDHEIRFTDDQIARVLQRLRDTGLYDQTIIAVLSDHGEGFGEHGIDFHGYHLYAAQTKVPFVMRVPGLPPGRVTMPVGHVDLLPTLANLAGARPDAAMLGRSLVDTLAGENVDVDRAVFQEVKFEGPTERYGAVTKKWHILYELMPNVGWEAYDREADPGETRDVSGSSDTSALRAQLLEWIDGLAFPPGAGELIRGAILDARPSPRHASDAEFGGAIRFLGADLPSEARAGQDIEAVWYFEARGTVKDDWLLFVHFDGRRRFTADHVPARGAFPFRLWQKGQLIADRQTLRIPAGTAPGEYTIHVGLWSRQKNQNMPATGTAVAANNRVRVGTLTVLP